MNITPLTIDEVRDDLTETIKQIAELEKSYEPPVVQELVLARRAAEDARMRLGVGLAYDKGFDPWVNKVDKKD